MPAGRPTALTEERKKQTAFYLKSGWEREGGVIPSVEGLARYLGVARSTVYKWAEDETTGFSDTLEHISELQKEITLTNGLTGQFNATIAKLVLANHGMSDKQEVEHSGKNGGPIEWAVNPVRPVDQKD